MTTTDQRRCRNCGADAPGAYCAACGQETREKLPTFGQFAREAMGRYVAFDGRLWKTLAGLLLRPGFLTREYLAGRRRRYIGPARLFLVSSLVLFAVLRVATEGLEVDAIQVEARTAPATAEDAAPREARTDHVARRGTDGVGAELDIDLDALSGSTGALGKRIERFNRLSREQKIDQVVAGTLRYGPYAMFALLPAFALLLKLLYVGGARRQPARPRLYGEHLVFAAHSHAFLALVVAALVVVPFGFARPLLGAWIAIYLARALRVAYGGSWLGVVSRGVVMLATYAVLFTLATAALLAAAVVLR